MQFNMYDDITITIFIIIFHLYVDLDLEDLISSPYPERRVFRIGRSKEDLYGVSLTPNIPSANRYIINYIFFIFSSYKNVQVPKHHVTTCQIITFDVHFNFWPIIKF